MTDLFFRLLLTTWPLWALASTVAAVPGVAQGRSPRSAGDDCSRVAASFVQLIGHDSHAVPHRKVTDDELEVCQTSVDHRKSCCTRLVERHLQRAAVDDMREIMTGASLHLKDLLIINSDLYRGEFLKLLSMSKNATKSTLSSPAFKLPPSEIYSSIDDLFLDLGRFMQQETKSMVDTITQFFDSLFPPVLIYTINDSNEALVPPDQRACFRRTRKDLTPAPFAESIHQLARDLDRSLGVIRILLDAFDLALEVINTTTHLHFEHECSRGLTRLLFCSYCEGHADVRPCRNLCMNVVHGCLAPLAGLDFHWNSFVDAVERVVLNMRGTENLQDVLGSFHSKISDSIMRTMETTHKYHAQLVSRCGLVVRWEEEGGPGASASPPPRPVRRPTAAETPDPQPSPSTLTRGPGTEVPLHLKIEMFVKNLAESREFYRKLPDSLCSSEKLSAGNYDVCWNGTSLGEYTKPVPVQDFSSQVADNPEMKVPESSETAMLAISKKLDDITKILNSREMPKLTSMLSDGRETDKMAEMSGNGNIASGYDEDDDDDEDASGGSAGEPEVTVPEVNRGGNGGRKGVDETKEEEDDNDEDEAVPYVTSPDFIFTEKSTRKTPTRPPTGIVITFTHTGAGSTFAFHKTGPLLLLTTTLSTALLSRIL